MRPQSPGIVGYVDDLTAHPGETVTLRVSQLDGGSVYRAELVRLICGETGPKGPGVKEEPVASNIDGEHKGAAQHTDCGSYVVIDSLPPLGAVAIELLVFPTLPGDGVQVIAALGPIRLALDETGAASLLVGATKVTTGQKLRTRFWHRVSATYDPATGAARIASAPFPGRHTDRAAQADAVLAKGAVPVAPLVFAAELESPGRSARHFDGRLEAPRIRSGRIELAWDFARGIGTARIEDISGNGAHGRTVNAPKRAVTGSTWDGSVHDWRQNPAQYGAIHFHRDDLADAGWKPSLSLRLPGNLRSGIYAVKLSASGPAFHVAFIVSPVAGKTDARVAVLASTLTYLAYSNYRRRMSPGPAELLTGSLPVVDMTDVLLAEHPEFGASTYDIHPDGYGVTHVSTRRPLFNMRPTGRFWNFNIDLSLIDWLDEQKIPYDVVSDHELHEKGATLLTPYAAVLTGSHPEYHTTETLQALEAFLDRGGRLMYLGGNGFYWRLTVDPAFPGVCELRRAEDGTRAWAEMPGEYYHSTGEYGGLWRRIGRPPNALVGIGFIAQGFDNSSYYRRSAASHDKRASFLFAGITDEIIGDFGASGDGAAGLELDCADLGLGTPPHTLVLASSENHSNAFLLVNEEIGSNMQGVDGTENDRVRADITFFETPSGGAVFATGSIAFLGSLAHNNYDNNISRLVGNALRRFIDPTPFAMPVV